MAKLEEYRRKRDFSRTREPAGADAPRREAGAAYVMHKHAASHDHFDLRLELDGVLKSWALPKGPGLAPGEKRLAVEVEDHPLEYGEFEGTIPKQEYGGGTVMVWDRGRWRVSGKANADRLDIELEGEKLRGAWTLTRMGGKRNVDGRQWLMIKRRADGEAALSPDDRSVASGRTMAEIATGSPATGTGSPAAGSTAAPPDPAALEHARAAELPATLTPQLATLVRAAPRGAAWLHELKFDGYRVMARLDHGEVRLITRNGKEWTARFPELAAALAALPVAEAVLDGEVVALARDGTSSFRRLQEALSAGRSAALAYQLFDLLHLDGYDLRETPLRERKRALKALLDAAATPSLRYSDHIEGQGEAFYQQACRLGLEGIIAKRTDAPYVGGRSELWQKIKCANHEEFVVGGYTDPGGARGGFGALLLGAFADDGRLVYAGRVGTGFSARQLEALHATLSAARQDDSPFNGPVPNLRGVHWVRPQLVVEVEFTERTRDGLLRHPAFRGVREDRNAAEIRADAGRGEPVAASGAPPARRRGDQAEVAGVRITHPERLLFPEQGLTKLDVARYYAEVAKWLLPSLRARPLALLRCPEGWQQECFFQKHPRVAIAARVPRVAIAEKRGTADYVYVEELPDLIALVQAGTLEFHPWSSRVDALERPDQLVFDLDPSTEVPWAETLRVAFELRERLTALGLESFVRTTGGKGLHLVVPLKPRVGWAEFHAFARAVARQHAGDDPARVTITQSKAKRRGRIYLDYRRNDRGATAIASYSLRAREGAPVAVPLRWDELNAALRGDRYSSANLHRRLGALAEDPWAGFDAARRPLTAKMRRAVGLD